MYLGCELKSFKCKNVRNHLKNILFIGHDFLRKGIEDFLYVAKSKPSLNFHIVGSDHSGFDPKDIIKKENLNNVTFYGKINNSSLPVFLDTIDLLFLPSRSEGFPKVIIETSSSGIPSLLYPDYGCSEWIENGNNGFIVENKIEALRIISMLEEKPDYLSEVSFNATELSKFFGWEKRIKDWEKAFLDVYER